MRAIVNVATGRYVVGAQRFRRLMPNEHFLYWYDQMPPGSPTHNRKPYAFKAYAMQNAIERGYTTLLWADSSIVPHRTLAPLWEQIERDGYWISRNGWTNYEWTNKAAYPLLGVTEEENQQIPHVVATSFGVSLKHPTGKRVFDEYLRLAQTEAFCGPWQGGIGERHRHDQTALSVIAYRAGCTLTDPPAYFSYRGGETDATFLIADGNY